ncbi:ABC transporter permease [Duodenibacillus massiliensis]|uniref:ABC transporter permease n=1 Tax=Duodenibacillus massiliensis TaxID=1852381 RepID=UPI003C6CD1A6
MKIVVLYTDLVMWFLAAAVLFFAVYAAKTPELAAKWKQVLIRPAAQACGTVLLLFFLLALADSVHWRNELPKQTAEATVAYDTKTVSLLDTLVLPHIAGRERSYSAPFTLHDFDKTTVIRDGKSVRDYQRLTGASPDVPEKGAGLKLGKRFFAGFLTGVIALSMLWIILALAHKAVCKTPFTLSLVKVTARTNPARPAVQVVQVAVLLAVILMFIWPMRHVCGTDATGNDVLYTALKSVRTAFVIGSLATLSALPFAVVLGIAAGYFKGKTDDVIQYIYTTLSSIPSVLLIAASVLMVQVFIDKNPQLYETGLERADVRLFLLAVIMGVTGWAALARLLRAETMKVAAMDFVTAAKAFGVSPWRIMARHVLPNVTHIVLIVAVLDFSGIVLYEAVLSYVGVGVDPTIDSFGTMINAAAVEMSRSPMIWWNLAACFLFMVTLVLCANLFASAVRDVFDPRSGSGAGGRVLRFRRAACRNLLALSGNPERVRDR